MTIQIGFVLAGLLVATSLAACDTDLLGDCSDTVKVEVASRP